MEVSWFDRTDMNLGYKCRTGLLTSEPCSLQPTDTDNAHTDNAPILHLMAEITAGRPEKRGTRARCAHNLRARGNSSRAPRLELLAGMRMSA